MIPNSFGEPYSDQWLTQVSQKVPTLSFQNKNKQNDTEYLLSGRHCCLPSQQAHDISTKIISVS